MAGSLPRLRFATMRRPFERRLSPPKLRFSKPGSTGHGENLMTPYAMQRPHCGARVHCYSAGYRSVALLVCRKGSVVGADFPPVRGAGT